MNTAVIIEKESFDALLDRIDSLTSTVEQLGREVRRDNKLYNITEAAKMMGIAKSTLHKHIRYNTVEYLLIGNSVYFTQELIDKNTKPKK